MSFCTLKRDDDLPASAANVSCPQLLAHHPCHISQRQSQKIHLHRMRLCEGLGCPVSEVHLRALTQLRKLLSGYADQGCDPPAKLPKRPGIGFQSQLNVEDFRLGRTCSQSAIGGTIMIPFLENSWRSSA